MQLLCCSRHTRVREEKLGCAAEGDFVWLDCYYKDVGESFIKVVFGKRGQVPAHWLPYQYSLSNIFAHLPTCFSPPQKSIMFARREASMAHNPDPRITEAAFLVNALFIRHKQYTLFIMGWYLHQGSLWGGTGISLCFLLFRVFVRLKAFRRLYSDDFIVIAAWTIKLVVTILWQMKAPVLYEHFEVMAGKKSPDVGFVNRDTALQRTVVPLSILFYSALWLVKLSFLMFFRRLGSKVKGQKIWWWFILVFTVLTWVACIADIEYKCSFNSYAFIICEFPPSCSGTHKSTNAEGCFADGRIGEKHIVGLWSQYVTKAACSMLTPWRTWLPTASVSLGRLHLAAPCTI